MSKRFFDKEIGKKESHMNDINIYMIVFFFSEIFK